MIKKVIFDGQLIALIISHRFEQQGVNFFTPDEASLQLAYMQLNRGKKIQSHIHNPVPRLVEYTQEAIVLKRGKLRLDLYSSDLQYLESHILEAGDIALLTAGGHGFEVLEEVELFEIKTGPYPGEADRTRFSDVLAEQVCVMELSAP